MSHINVQRIGRTGTITLYRPEVSNTINYTMVKDLITAFESFHKDTSIELVIVRSGIQQAFSAGRDIQSIHDFCLSGQVSKAEDFFNNEYRLNALIATFQKPIIFMVDGLCVGSGLSLIMHGRYCVTTERSVFAMPGTEAGLIPNVGSSYRLPRLPWGAGRWLGLTGEQISGADAFSLGFATHLTDPKILSELLDALITTEEPPETLLKRFSWKRTSCKNLARLVELGKSFSAKDLGSIRDRLHRENSDNSKRALRVLSTIPDDTLRQTITMLNRGEELSFEDCLSLELNQIRSALQRSDLLGQTTDAGKTTDGARATNTSQQR